MPGINYLQIVNNQEPTRMLEGGTNKIGLYESAAGKFLHITRRPEIISGKPFERYSAPRLAELGENSLKWMSHSDEESMTKDLEGLGIGIVPILETGEGYMIRGYKELETLRQKLAKGDLSSMPTWLENIVRAHGKGIKLTDRITANTFIDTNGTPLSFDFDKLCNDMDFSLAQALFYSMWLTDIPEEIKKIGGDVLEGNNQSGVYNMQLVKQYIQNYVEKVIDPESPDSVFSRIEVHPDISTDKLKIEHRAKLQDILRTFLIPKTIY